MPVTFGGRGKEGCMFTRGIVVVLGSLAIVNPAYAADKAKEAAPVSEAQMKKTAAQVKSQGDETVKAMLGLLDAARKEKDLLKANCVTERLTAAKELLMIAGKAEIALQEKISQKEPGPAQHEYEKIDIAGGNLKALLLEARSCVGVTYTGETKLEVEEPKNLPDVPIPGKTPTSPVLPPGPTGPGAPGGR